MTYSIARDTIVRKFTNYRNHHKQVESRRSNQTVALKEAGEKLADLKTYNRGKRLFKAKHQDAIDARRIELLASNPTMLPIVAYQKALKVLWANEDEAYWDSLAETEFKDEIYEYVFDSQYQI